MLKRSKTLFTTLFKYVAENNLQPFPFIGIILGNSVGHTVGNIPGGLLNFLMRNVTQLIDEMKKVVIHTDGACHGNPGPGGWAATLDYGGHHREISGGAPATTNNRMELQAAIEALTALKEPCEIEFYTDSEYLKNGMTSWLTSWKLNGWKTKSKTKVKNEDLWRKLDSLASKHRANWHWLKGHNGHAGNERCDQLANEEIGRLVKEYTPAQLKAKLKELARGDA